MKLTPDDNLSQTTNDEQSPSNSRALRKYGFLTRLVVAVISFLIALSVLIWPSFDSFANRTAMLNYEIEFAVALAAGLAAGFAVRLPLPVDEYGSPQNRTLSQLRGGLVFGVCFLIVYALTTELGMRGGSELTNFFGTFSLASVFGLMLGVPFALLGGLSTQFGINRQKSISAAVFSGLRRGAIVALMLGLLILVTYPMTRMKLGWPLVFAVLAFVLIGGLLGLIDMVFVTGNLSSHQKSTPIDQAIPITIGSALRIGFLSAIRDSICFGLGFVAIYGLLWILVGMPSTLWLQIWEAASLGILFGGAVGFLGGFWDVVYATTKRATTRVARIRNISP